MKFPVWATVFTVLGAALLFRLGFWQLERSAWKASLLESLEKSSSAESLSQPLLKEGQSLNALQEYQSGFIEGTYLLDRSFLLGPRLHDKVPGFHLLTPLKAGEAVLFVNRGWVPKGYSLPAAGPVPVRVAGLLRTPEAANFSVPANQPEKNLWSRYDLEAFALSRKLEGVLPFVFYLESERFSEQVPFENPSPTALTLRPSLSNNHAAYAVFWFTMGGLLILFYYLRFHNNFSRKP